MMKQREMTEDEILEFAGHGWLRYDEECRRAAQDFEADKLREVIDAVLVRELSKRKQPPSEEVFEKFRDEQRDFSRWCLDFRVSSLPAKGASVCAYLIFRAADDGWDVLRARKAVEAISFMHRLGEFYIDHDYIDAALEFLSRGDGDGGLHDDVVKKSNGGDSMQNNTYPESPELPLAANSESLN
jgi:hypothetical protein